MLWTSVRVRAKLRLMRSADDAERDLRFLFKAAAASHYEARKRGEAVNSALFLYGNGRWGGHVPEDYAPWFPELSSNEIVDLLEKAVNFRGDASLG